MTGLLAFLLSGFDPFFGAYFSSRGFLCSWPSPDLKPEISCLITKKFLFGGSLDLEAGWLNDSSLALLIIVFGILLGLHEGKLLLGDPLGFNGFFALILVFLVKLLLNALN